MNLKKRLVLGEMVVALVSYWAALPESARADTTDVEAVYRHYATKREE